MNCEGDLQYCVRRGGCFVILNIDFNLLSRFMTSDDSHHLPDSAPSHHMVLSSRCPLDLCTLCTAHCTHRCTQFGGQVQDFMQDLLVPSLSCAIQELKRYRIVLFFSFKMFYTFTIFGVNYERKSERNLFLKRSSSFIMKSLSVVSEAKIKTLIQS